MFMETTGIFTLGEHNDLYCIIPGLMYNGYEIIIFPKDGEQATPNCGCTFSFEMSGETMFANDDREFLVARATNILARN